MAVCTKRYRSTSDGKIKFWIYVKGVSVIKNTQLFAGAGKTFLACFAISLFFSVKKTIFFFFFFFFTNYSVFGCKINAPPCIWKLGTPPLTTGLFWCWNERIMEKIILNWSWRVKLKLIGAFFVPQKNNIVHNWMCSCNGHNRRCNEVHHCILGEGGISIPIPKFWGVF